MTLEHRYLKNAAIISIGSELDFFGCIELLGAIYSAAALKPIFVVSLEACDYCDLSGVRTMLTAKRWLKQRLEIVIPRGHQAHRLIAILGWSGLIRPLETLRELPVACRP